MKYEVETTTYQAGVPLYKDVQIVVSDKKPKVGEQQTFLTTPPMIKRITDVKLVE